MMAIIGTALRGSGIDWSGAFLIIILAVMTVGAMVVIPSARARGWFKVKVAKHLFEHRYDYRAEWLRFTQTLGRAGPDAGPLGERIVKAFADMADAPGGLLLVSDGGRGVSVAGSWNWSSATPPVDQLEEAYEFWKRVEESARIVEFEGLRHGWADSRDKALTVPPWMLVDESIWAGVPLIHHQRLIGMVLLAAPEYRRAFDWEDFDLLRTAGNQAASSLAESFSQEALANAQRFEEFNRRFAFILHDIKNLVSQLSLVARNSERHADNPEFRADMVATLKSSVGKMNDLLARLAPSDARVGKPEPQPLWPILQAAIAAKSSERDVKLAGDSRLWATVDATAIEQAVGHLVQNAVEASSDGEPVAVHLTGGDNSVSIEIADKGCGMDAEFVRNRLFQPFASTKESGFGIGAFEAQSLITAMRGRISVDSRPGVGTTFTITLPATEPAQESERKYA
jgi:putative PEP-CTERM system histidine kinase